MRRRIPSLFLMSIITITWQSVYAYEDQIAAIANTVAERIAEREKSTTAVVDFTDLNGKVTELGRFLAEELSVALAWIPTS